MAQIFRGVGVLFLGLICVVFAENPEAVDQSAVKGGNPEDQSAVKGGNPEAVDQSAVKGNSGMIAFSVGLSNEVNNAPGTHLTVPYNVVNLNVGGGFDTASYQFFAPVNGIYQFSFCMLSQTGGGRMVVSLMLGGTGGQQLSSTHGYYNGFDPGCQIQLVELVATDAISVVIRGASEKGMYESGNKYSTFSGYLIHETI